MYQQLILIGNVGQEPTMQYTPQGVAVTRFTLAVNKVTGKGETRKEKTTWFRVSVWRERAEVANTYIKKGAKVMVVGEISVQAYIDKQGAAQATLEVVASDFKFLDRAPDDEHRQPAGAAAGNGHGGYVPPQNPDDPNDVPF